MAGLALGSFVFARRLSRFPNLIRAYGWLEIGIGVYCALLPVLLWLASVVYLRAHGALGLSYDAFSLFQFLLVFLLLLVPTTLMGGTLPILSQALVTQDRGLGAKVGALYAVNTFGAVVGVALAGYVLLPAIGNRLTIAVAATANVLSASWPSPMRAGIRCPRRRSRSPRRPRRARASARGRPRTVDRGRRGGGRRDRAPRGLAHRGRARRVRGGVARLRGRVDAGAVPGHRQLHLRLHVDAVAFLVGIAGGSALYSWLWGARAASLASSPSSRSPSA